MYHDGPDRVGVSDGRDVSVGGSSVGVSVIVAVAVAVEVGGVVEVGVMVGVKVGLSFIGLSGPISHTTSTAAPMITTITVNSINKDELRGPCRLRR
jgi:hypothetical protein